MAAVGAVEIAAELEIVGRIGEDHVDRFGGQRLHHRDAIAAQDRIERQRRRRFGRRPCPDRSEEHTSELQSLMRTSYAVFCLKQKNKSQHLSCTAYTASLAAFT